MSFPIYFVTQIRNGDKQAKRQTASRVQCKCIRNFCTRNAKRVYSSHCDARLDDRFDAVPCEFDRKWDEAQKRGGYMERRGVIPSLGPYKFGGCPMDRKLERLGSQAGVWLRKKKNRGHTRGRVLVEEMGEGKERGKRFELF